MNPSGALPSVLPVLEHRDGGSTVTFSDSGRSWAGVHGGLLVGALVDAAALHTSLVPMTVTVHLHAAVPSGVATIATSTTVVGRSFTSATAVLDSGRRCATAFLLLTGPPGGAVQHWTGGRPDFSGLPGPQDVDRLEGVEAIMPIAQHFDIRPVGRARPFAGGKEAELTAWIRLLPAPDYREAVAAVLLDALAPSLYAVMTAPIPIPTVEFTVHFTPARPTGEWFLIRQRTTWSTAELCVDEAELCTPDGQVVARSRQLRRILG
jgi:hypothetical protein